ncbi:hypothetical protein VNO77_03083 [Canavalia gladiata]|uniref:Uncharacterized protein n=1 Tax=Canavalia gladiata TaxID=3824 RepID=A0AAN9R7U1_CANGL
MWLAWPTWLTGSGHVRCMRGMRHVRPCDRTSDVIHLGADQPQPVLILRFPGDQEAINSPSKDAEQTICVKVKNPTEPMALYAEKFVVYDMSPLQNSFRRQGKERIRGVVPSIC